MKYRYFFILIFFSLSMSAQDYQFVQIKINKGQTLYSLFKAYHLDFSKEGLNEFYELNNLKEDAVILSGKNYKLPIKEYKYNGKSIRSTIGNNNMQNALKIKEYNELLQKSRIKKKIYTDDLKLWVPEIYRENSTSQPNDDKSMRVPIFGTAHQNVKIIDQKLKGIVYYIVSGHGGPDPGAVGKLRGHDICEDEYAYDIALRFGKNLLSHGASVFFIIRDPNDGIRGGNYLKCDKDETCWLNQEIPLNPIKRLRQREKAIDKLYIQNKKKGFNKQRALIIHVDSRSQRERVDMFFYHNPNSSSGKKIANSLKNTIQSKYKEHQCGRGYSGTVSSRNLHMLRETRPTAVYVELGNIRNYRDQQRFILENNRQAVANWLAEGVLKFESR